VKKADPRGELAPRDIVARAIDEELKRTGEDCVFLDITSRGADFLRRRFPKIHERCLSFGIDITTQPIPVVPAAHYFCGGVWTDLHGDDDHSPLVRRGRSRLHRVARGQPPGVQLLAGGLGLRPRRGAPMGGTQNAPRSPSPRTDVPPWNPGQARNPDEQVVIRQVWEEVRRFMWNYVGIARTTKRLERAQSRIAFLQKEIHEYYWDFLLTPDLLELRNIAVVADLVIRCGWRGKNPAGCITPPIGRAPTRRWRGNRLSSRERGLSSAVPPREPGDEKRKEGVVNPMEERLRTRVRALCDDFYPRDAGHPEVLARAADHLAAEFRALG
jgi:L-aspartate oxidase